MSSSLVLPYLPSGISVGRGESRQGGERFVDEMKMWRCVEVPKVNLKERGGYREVPAMFREEPPVSTESVLR
jgi:hypothetical protein